MKTIEELAQLVLKFHRDNLASHGVALSDFLERLAKQVETEILAEMNGLFDAAKETFTREDD